MPYFVFKAVNSRDKQVRGRIFSETLAEAHRLLRNDYKKVLECREEMGVLSTIDRWLISWRKPSAVEIALTTRQMAVMLNSGVPITRSLEVLCMQPLARRLGDAWQSVAVDVHQGNTISRSLIRHPDCFSMLFVGMVRAGEVSGRLASNLIFVADYLEKEAFVRARIKAALTYPAFVFAICTLLMFLIIEHILPQFLNGIFRDSGLNLPWCTKLLMVVTDFLSRPLNIVGLGAVAALLGYAFFRYFRTPVGAYNLERLLFSIPIFRPALERIMAARFCRTLSTLMVCGVPLQTALEITDIVVGSHLLSEHIQNASRLVQEGTPLCTGIGMNPYFPRTVSSFVELGEETGRIGPLLSRLAALYEEDLDLALTELTLLIEPAIMLVMGFFVGFVIISVFIPLYGLMSDI